MMIARARNELIVKAAHALENMLKSKIRCIINESEEQPPSKMAIDTVLFCSQQKTIYIIQCGNFVEDEDLMLGLYLRLASCYHTRTRAIGSINCANQFKGEKKTMQNGQ